MGPCGPIFDPRGIQVETEMVPREIQDGSTGLVSRWVQVGPFFDPIRTQRETQEVSRWVQVDPSFIQDGYKQKPKGLQDWSTWILL